MKTDPNKACQNREERLFWAVLHDAVAHPVMALTGYCGWAMKFHNYTSHKAWPRPAGKAVNVLTARRTDG